MVPPPSPPFQYSATYAFGYILYIVHCGNADRVQTQVPRNRCRVGNARNIKPCGERRYVLGVISFFRADERLYLFRPTRARYTRKEINSFIFFFFSELAANTGRWCWWQGRGEWWRLGCWDGQRRRCRSRKYPRRCWHRHRTRKYTAVATTMRSNCISLLPV